MREMSALLSNKKPDTHDTQDTIKMPKMPDAKIQDAKIQDAPNTDAKTPEERHALDWYNERLEEMNAQVQRLERVIEDNEVRYFNELRNAQDLRSENERDAGSAVAARELKTELRITQMELKVRERELAVAAREHTGAGCKERRADSDSDEEDELSGSFSSGPISAPGAYVILDLANTLKLEPKLHNEKMQIATLTSLFESCLSRFPVLKLQLDAVNTGHSVEWAIDQFARNFAALIKVRRMSTLDVIKIIGLSRMNNALKVKVQSAVKVAGSVRLEYLKPMSMKAAQDGIIHVLDVEHSLKKFQELPGIVELLHSGSADHKIHWSEIGKYVLNVACFERDKKSKLRAARADLDAFDGRGYSDYDLFVAEFSRLFDICTSWLKEPIEKDFDKIQRLLIQCIRKVRRK